MVVVRDIPHWQYQSDPLREVLGRKLIRIGQLCPPSSLQLDHHSSAGASCLVHRPPRGFWPIWLAATILVVLPRWLVGVVMLFGEFLALVAKMVSGEGVLAKG
jgi:hypothetical protein